MASTSQQQGAPEINPEPSALSQNPYAQAAAMEVLSTGHVLVTPDPQVLANNSESSPLLKALNALSEKAVILNAGNCDFIPDPVRGKMLMLNNRAAEECCIISSSEIAMEALLLQKLDEALPIESSMTDALQRLGIPAAVVDNQATQQLFSELEQAVQQSLEKATTDSRSNATVEREGAHLQSIPVAGHSAVLLTATGNIGAAIEGTPLAEHLLSAVEAHHMVILDVSDATSLNMEAIGQLLTARKRLGETDQKIVIISGSVDTLPAKKMHQVRLEQMIDIVGDLNEALEK